MTTVTIAVTWASRRDFATGPRNALEGPECDPHDSLLRPHPPLPVPLPDHQYPEWYSRADPSRSPRPAHASLGLSENRLHNTTPAGIAADRSRAPEIYSKLAFPRRLAGLIDRETMKEGMTTAAAFPWRHQGDVNGDVRHSCTKSLSLSQIRKDDLKFQPYI